jgi:hypothetical protein
MGTVDYAQALRTPRRFMDVRLARPVLVMAVLTALMGLFFFFGIVTRLF